MPRNNGPDACGVLVLLLLILIIYPLAGLWTINMLFDVNNPYDLPHMFAMICAGVFLWGSTN